MISNSFDCSDGPVSRHLYNDGVFAFGLAKLSETIRSFVDSAPFLTTGLVWDVMYCLFTWLVRDRFKDSVFNLFFHNSVIFLQLTYLYEFLGYKIKASSCLLFVVW